jgi:ATP phosphoribosyltransferase regulatory subunit
MPTSTRYPTGVRALLAEETAKRRRIESRFVAALESAGFAEIALPIIDFVAPYDALLDRDALRQSYRFVDREGELVAIRSDFTPLVARAVAPAIASSDLPLHLFYRGDVIRCEASRLGANRELFQIGAETIGDASVDADIATLQLASSLVRTFALHPAIVYNDVSIAEALIGGSAAIRTALVAKRASALDDARDAIPRDRLTLIEQLIAGTATLDDARRCEVTANAAERLAAIAQSVGDDCELHLDDIDPSPAYYTGLRFRIYAGDARTRVAQGGRYDDLYRRFGTAAPAIGFTFTIDDLD